MSTMTPESEASGHDDDNGREEDSMPCRRPTTPGPFPGNMILPMGGGSSINNQEAPPLPSELVAVLDNLRQSADSMQPATQLLMECFMSYFTWAAAGGHQAGSEFMGSLDSNGSGSRGRSSTTTTNTTITSTSTTPVRGEVDNDDDGDDENEEEKAEEEEEKGEMKEGRSPPPTGSPRCPPKSAPSTTSSPNGKDKP